MLALYRKYRSRDFQELVGQDHVAKSLEAALGQARISHAYLFTGPRGVGKTSTARILARRINGLSTEEARNHLDIIEIDAASNRRIDEIRDLREKVHIAPTSSEYKVYIIDEVHMLTSEAFNALLKTLEEPPAHVIFILATTEPHKLPDTIISRTQRYSFRPVTAEAIAGHLKVIAKSEQIAITDGALRLIAEAGDGSFRDSISFLDQLAGSSRQELDEATVASLIGLPDITTIENLLKALLGNQPVGALEAFDRCLQNGSTTAQIAQRLLVITQKLLRQVLGNDSSASAFKPELLQLAKVERLTQIMQALATLPTQSLNPSLALEALLLRLSSQPQAEAAPAKAAQPVRLEKTPTTPTKPQPDVKKTIEKPAPASTSEGTIQGMNEAVWAKVLSQVKARNNSLYGVLRSAQLAAAKDTVLLRFKFQFHRKLLENVSNRKVVEEALTSVLGKKALLKTELVAKKKAPLSAKEDNDAINNVMQILGGEIVRG